MVQPLKAIALIEVIKEEKNVRGTIVTDESFYFDKATVLAVGPLIKDIKKGDIVYVHKGVWEPIERGSKTALISQTDIFAIVK